MKKWLTAVLCVTLCLLLAVGAANFLIDPLMQYRTLPDCFRYAAFDYDYINPGYAAHTAYDAVLLGSSLAENADMDVYENAFGVPMVKLLCLGGSVLNFSAILDCVFRTHAPQLVIWTVDEAFFLYDSQTLGRDIPQYLYDTNRLNDISYLLNAGIFYNYSVKTVLLTARGRSNRPILRGNVWSGEGQYGRQAVLDKRDSLPSLTDPATADLVGVCAEDNLRSCILPLLEAHPDTQFCFCFPPKNIVYWQDALRAGSFDARFDAMEQTMQTLLQTNNARVFFYADRMEWTTDYDLYRDTIHYKQSVNNAMGEDMANGVGEVTADTVSAVLDRCKAALRTAVADANM